VNTLALAGAFAHWHYVALPRRYAASLPTPRSCEVRDERRRGEVPSPDPVVDAGQDAEGATPRQERGLRKYDTQVPYIAAVACALQREGIDWQNYGTDGDLHEGSIELEFAFDGDESMYVAWRETEGWFYFTYPEDHQSALGESPYPLPVPVLAEPHGHPGRAQHHRRPDHQRRTAVDTDGGIQPGPDLRLRRVVELTSLAQQS
jgi:hypothetical protein